MAEKIEVGTVVRLKSGGPKMTVQWIEDDMAGCVWFDSKGAQQAGNYPIATLEVS